MLGDPDLDPGAWDRFVADAIGGSVFQTVAWGEARRKSGWAPIRLAVRDAEGWAAAVLLGLRRVGPLAVLHAQRGPVFRAGAEEALPALLDLVESRAREERAVFIKMTPDLERGDACLGLFRERAYRPVPGDAYAHRSTYRLDLSGGEAAVRARLEGRTRRALDRGVRDGVEVRSGIDGELVDRFLTLADGTAERRGFPSPGAPFVKDLVQRLGASDRLRVFLARREGKDLAGAVVLRFGVRCTYMWGGSTGEPKLRRSNPAEALQWAAIRWAIDSGCKEYDLQGVPLDGEGQPAGGLALFKRGFGGRLVHLAGDLDRPTHPAAYLAWRCLEPLYLWMKGVRG